MIHVACISDFLSSNQDHIWYALSGLGAIGTLCVAFSALNTWRKEKEYDLVIENLAICNVAVQFIAALRYPASSTGEIKKEYQEEIDKRAIDDQKRKSAAEELFIYQSRRDRQQDLFENILKLREKNWAVYGETHDFYLFFNKIVEFDNEIRMAYIRYYHAILDREDYPEDVFKAIRKETRPIMYSKLSDDDPITKELTGWVEKLKKYRKKQ
ncbi:hypothetical protein [Mucilaginibacter sp.]|uniref:hypothetical protein n=1 Tax=Mucilaginibacter sp. TaxID=1882438 RepID=UPI002622641E|nr:hypothetical protein [Mucilaginibacter sp.]MDB4921342.1 hypothetical protein [Mucilaginibacter sp.]